MHVFALSWRPVGRCCGCSGATQLAGGCADTVAATHAEQGARATVHDSKRHAHMKSGHRTRNRRNCNRRAQLRTQVIALLSDRCAKGAHVSILPADCHAPHERVPLVLLAGLAITMRHVRCQNVRYVFACDARHGTAVEPHKGGIACVIAAASQEVAMRMLRRHENTTTA